MRGMGVISVLLIVLCVIAVVVGAAFWAGYRVGQSIL